jgi:hypothetical protein
MSESKNIFLPHPSPEGYMWTIVSQLGCIFREIRKLYGERDKSFTILGVELTSEGNPGNIFVPVGYRLGRCVNLIL